MLLVRGMMKATEISRSLEMHRLDVYNALRILQQREIVTATLSRPMSFKAEPLDSVLDIVRKKFEEESEERKRALLLLESSKGLITEALSRSKRFPEESETLQIISGRKAISQRWLRVVASAKAEILIASTSEGTARFLLTEAIDAIKEKMKQGVSVRIFTPVSSKNIAPVKEIESEVRHLTTSGSGGLCVVDESQAVIVIETALHGEQSKVVEDNAIYTTSKSMAAMLRTLFFVGWDTSPTVEEQLGRIALARSRESVSKHS
jgi:sugar-specific transcriptional regulator TrmB